MKYYCLKYVMSLYCLLFVYLSISPSLAKETPPHVPIPQVLFVVKNTSLAAGDPSVYNRLQAQGFGVEIRDENTVNASHADGKDVVIISSSVSSSALNSIFKEVAVPLLTWEAYIYDDMKLTGSGGNNLGVSYGQTQIQITQSSHSMAAGLSGTLSVYNNASELAWGKPTAGAEVIASLAGDVNKAVIFGYDTGASMEGIAAPARRVGFFLFNDAANQLNTQGWMPSRIFYSFLATYPELRLIYCRDQLSSKNFFTIYPTKEYLGVSWNELSQYQRLDLP